MKLVKDSESAHLIYDVIDEKNGNVVVGYIRRTSKGVWQFYLEDGNHLDIEEMEEILKLMKDRE